MAAEEKLSAVLEKELDAIDKDCIRPLQVKAFQCCTKCCENRATSQPVLQTCLQNCMRPVVESEDVIKQEIENLQGRLTRCAQQCQDSFSDILSTDPTHKDKAKKQAEDCLLKCADTHIPLMTKMFIRIKQQLNSC